MRTSSVSAARWWRITVATGLRYLDRCHYLIDIMGAKVPTRVAAGFGYVDLAFSDAHRASEPRTYLLVTGSATMRRLWCGWMGVTDAPLYRHRSVPTAGGMRFMPAIRPVHRPSGVWNCHRWHAQEMVMSERRTPLTALPFWPRYLSREEAARYVGVSPDVFDDEIDGGHWPQARRRGGKGGRLTWDRLALDAAADKDSGIGQGVDFEAPEPNPWKGRSDGATERKRA